jgi:fatty-acyl-CoA synthase
VEASLLAILEPIRGELKTVERIIVLDDLGGSAEPLDYEALLAEAPETLYGWPRLDENAAAAMCYTSGTTGEPKGVVYSHRSLFLHSYGLCMVDSFALSEGDTILQVIPMFHASGWGIPYAGIMTGSRLVLSGRQPQPADLAQLIEKERVTFSSGVPTVWMTLYNHVESHPHDLSSLRLVFVAGAALPRQFVELYQKKYGVYFMLGWGMTEISPIATVTSMKSHLKSLPEEQRLDLMARHGFPLAGVDIRIVDPAGEELPWDGVAMGELQARGPWVAGSYYRDPRSDASFQDGWLRTGDIATIDAEGYIQITDRTKDLVKSGGEWISSVDLENAIMAHPKVAEAAVVGVYHPKWQERPLACVVPLAGNGDQVTKQEILDFLATRIAKWWLPDDVVFIEAVPKTSVGKFNKRALRERFKDYKLPTLA